jgi:hypothetical protein
MARRRRGHVRAPALASIGLGAALGWLALGSPARAEPAVSAPRCTAARCGAIEGELKAGGDRTPIAGATVLVVPAEATAKPGRVRDPGGQSETPAWMIAVTTDADGRFEVPDVPGPRVRVVVIALGFLRAEHIVAIAPGKTTRATVFAPPDPDEPYRTVVAPPSAPAATEEPARRVLEREEIRTAPGTQGDPLRALQNLPGVARVPGGLGLLVLRGAAPNQSRVYLGGHAIPRAFHVLSLASVFPADILDQLDFLPGNFDARYGNATGGIVVVEPRAPRRDGFHGFGKIDLTAAGAMVEGPLKKGSFAVAAQRGYVDAVVAAATRVIERVTGESSDFLLPAYYDYQGIFDYPLRVGRIGLRVFGAGDRLRSRADSASTLPGEIGGRSDFLYRSDFHRVDVPWTVQTSRTTTRVIPSVRFEIGRHVLSGDTLRRRRIDAIPALRIETERRIATGFSLLFGTDLEVDAFWAKDDQLLLQPADPMMPAVRTETSARGTETRLGAYATAELARGPFTIRPGARASAFTVKDQGAFSIDPRVIAHVDVAEAWRLSAGLGRYSQVREISDQDTVDLFEQGAGLSGASLYLPSIFSRFDPDVRFAPADTQLTVRQALQASAGAEYRFFDDWSASLTGFLREQDNAEPLVFSGNRVDSASKSRDYGLEVLVRRRLAGRLYGWLAYTLLFSDLRLVQAPPGQPLVTRPSDFDQRHNFVALVSYALPKNWRIGARFRVSSGYPYQPVIGSLNVRGGFLPIRGERNVARLPPFHQLDLRVDKVWVRSRAVISTYVDVQNVYNRNNPEAILYSTDFREAVDVVGMPIFPSLGVRVDF